MPTESQKKKMKEKEKLAKMIAFDFETTQSIENDAGEFQWLENHVVVCVVARKVRSQFIQNIINKKFQACYYCYDARRTDINVNCSKCGEHEVVFSYCNSEDVLNDFIDYLFLPQHSQSHVFAHFGEFINIHKSI